MNKTRLLLLLIAVLFLQGCPQNSQIEETAIINSRGVDLVEEGGERLIETTIMPYIFDPNVQKATNILIGRGRTIKEARESAAEQSSHRLSPGKINVDVYGKEAAEAGILPFITTLTRDARVSDRMQIIVTDQTAKEILTTEQESIAINSAEFLQDLIEKEVTKGVIPRNTLEYFTRLAEQVGIDALIPIMNIVEEKPRLTGVAVFNADKYAASISMQESFLINLLRKKASGTPLEAEVPLENYREMIHYPDENLKENETLYVFLNNAAGRGQLDIINDDELSFKAEINLNAELIETSVPMELKSEEVVKRMENDLNSYFEGEYEKLFAKVQEVQSDVFGLGRVYVSTRKGSSTTEEEWKEMYQDATVEFDVNITIINTGTID